MHSCSMMSPQQNSSENVQVSCVQDSSAKRENLNTKMVTEPYHWVSVFLDSSCRFTYIKEFPPAFCKGRKGGKGWGRAGGGLWGWEWGQLGEGSSQVH